MQCCECFGSAAEFLVSENCCLCVRCAVFRNLQLLLSSWYELSPCVPKHL